MIPVQADIAIYAGAVQTVRFVLESAPAGDYVLLVYGSHSVVSVLTVVVVTDGNTLLAEFDSDNFSPFAAYRYELRRAGRVPDVRGAIRYETAWTDGQIPVEQYIAVPVVAGQLLFNGEGLLYNGQSLTYNP